MKPSTTSQILTTKCVLFHTRESTFLRVLELCLQYPQALPELQQGREAPGAPLHNPAEPCSFTAGERALRKRVASTCWRWETLMRDPTARGERPMLWGSRDASLLLCALEEKRFHPRGPRWLPKTTRQGTQAHKDRWSQMPECKLKPNTHRSEIHLHPKSLSLKSEKSTQATCKAPPVPQGCQSTTSATVLFFLLC